MLKRSDKLQTIKSDMDKLDLSGPNLGVATSKLIDASYQWTPSEWLKWERIPSHPAQKSDVLPPDRVPK